MIEKAEEIKRLKVKIKMWDARDAVRRRCKKKRDEEREEAKDKVSKRLKFFRDRGARKRGKDYRLKGGYITKEFRLKVKRRLEEEVEALKVSSIIRGR